MTEARERLTKLADRIDSEKDKGCEYIAFDREDSAAIRSLLAGEGECPNPNGCEYCREFGCPNATGVVISDSPPPSGKVVEAARKLDESIGALCDLAGPPGKLEAIRQARVSFRQALIAAPTPSPDSPRSGDGCKLVPVEPTREMIDQGAQRLASFGDDSVWPDSWSVSEVAQMRLLAERVVRSAICAAPPTPSLAIVPREPTEAMLQNTVNERQEPSILKYTTPEERSLPFLMPRYIWRAMVDAAAPCQTCMGRGEIGGFDHAEAAYRTEPCPDCAALTNTPTVDEKQDQGSDSATDPSASGRAKGAPSLTADEKIKAMVDRFLSWKLPADFSPDCGIHFDADAGVKLNPRNSRYEPVGTNLFTATQATAMVRHMVGGLK